MVISASLASVVFSLAAGSVGTVPVFSDGDGVVLSHRSPGMAGRDVGVVYDANSQAGNNFQDTTGPGGSLNEDYVSTITSPSTLAEFEFLGGVDTDGHVVFFSFFAADFTFVDGFGVALPVSGTQIWTITLGDPSAISVPAAGFVTMGAADANTNPDGMPTNGTWWYTDAAPAIGSSSGDVYRMKITVIPGPGACVLLGVGGVMGLRRRR